MNTTTIQQTTATAQALEALGKSLTLAACNLAKVVYQLAALLVLMICKAWQWLNTPHTVGDDSEAVTLNGWQYLGIGAISFVCGFILSIEW